VRKNYKEKEEVGGGGGVASAKELSGNLKKIFGGLRTVQKI